MASNIPIHRKLGSGYTKIKDLTTGKEFEVSGRSLLIEASMDKISNLSKDRGQVTQGCVSPITINMVSDFSYFDGTNNVTAYDYIGLYNSDEIEAAFSKFEKSKILLLENLYDFFLKRDFLLNNIQLVKNAFRMCESDQYFFIPLNLRPLTSKIKTPGHANGIFISKSKGTVFRVEPQYYVNLKDPNYIQKNEAIKKGIIKLTNEIGLKDPTFIDINVPCPQAIIEDKSCIFWSLLIFEQIIKNLYKKDINTAIQEISNKSKKELEDIIYNYQRDLFSKWVPTYLTKDKISWPDFENNKSQILHEIDTIRSTQTGIPVQAEDKVSIKGGKTRRRKIKKSKKRLTRRH